MEWRLVSKIAALAVALPTTAVLLYWLFIRKDYDDAEDEQLSGDGSAVSRHTVIQVTVPNKTVGALIGTKGANIKKIQKETGTRIDFSDQYQHKSKEGDGGSGEGERVGEGADRTVFIRGDSQSAQQAEILIRQAIADMPQVITEVVEVPLYSLGRLIGKGGETIRGISSTTRCKIFIDRAQDGKGPEVPREVAITGTKQDIPLAKEIIQEKVMEAEEFRSKMAIKGANREQRKGGKNKSPEAQPASKERQPLVSRVVDDTKACWDSGDQVTQGQGQKPRSAEVKEFMDVFVSAIEHTGHFWLQIVNQSALNLDDMTEDMSVFYSDPKNTEKYKASSVKVGDIIAAPFSEDSKWYRARVEVLGHDGKADLYYIDFGDNGSIPLENLCELKPEYLSLPIQAIECKLANVRPTGEEWSDESSDTFEELSHCAQWKILAARTVGYLPVEGGNQWPCMQLVDNNTSPPTDIAQEMVSRGLALWENPPPHSPSSPCPSQNHSSPPSSHLPPTLSTSAAAACEENGKVGPEL